MTEKLINAYCTVDWADLLFSEYIFNELWQEASVEKKLSALNTATEFIDLYCTFFNNKAEETSYPHSDEFTADDPNDMADIINPGELKRACAFEASYLLSLDDNPAEPHPITILGLLKMENFTVDKENVPPIFPGNVVKLLENMGGVIEREAIGGVSSWMFQRYTT